jgi:hypothetical protein
MSGKSSGGAWRAAVGTSSNRRRILRRNYNGAAVATCEYCPRVADGSFLFRGKSYDARWSRPMLPTITASSPDVLGTRKPRRETVEIDGESFCVADDHFNLVFDT